MHLLQVFIFNLVFILTSSTELYNEKYRPQLHYSPPKGWMNDPNGLLFYKDVYHLFYQFYPNDTKWGPMHWGHATSKDLLHWETLPIALYPQGNEYIFSGSTLIDYKNVTGFQPANESNKTMIAIFTAHTNPEHNEKQWMAYSNNEGLDWKFYENNPIIPEINQKDFRDPNTFKYGDHFVAVLVASNHIQIYNSEDLKNWTLVSTFGHNQGSHQGVWECPALFPLNVKVNGTNVEKWVLLISIDNSTEVSTGPTMQYFIGSFDGKTFTNDNSNDTILWIDYGPDSYAGVTYNETPDKRRIFMVWMNRWDYADSLSFNVWNGQMAMPRVFNLVENSDNKLFLSSVPVSELNELRIHLLRWTDLTLEPNFTKSITNMRKMPTNLLDIELTVDVSLLGPTDRFGFEFNGEKDKLKVYYNGSFVIDRTNAGRHDFSVNYGLVYKAPRLTSSPSMNLRLILDVSSVELFADNGLTSMTSLFFTDNNLSSDITLFYESESNTSQLKAFQLNVYQLKSVWK